MQIRKKRHTCYIYKLFKNKSTKFIYIYEIFTSLRYN
ncbi:unnamed protein product [Larinioides sclopetarius]|uniref:Uncharacterized protein n=1 Tax=Larinioides sclopetarius TaxID=280406 RepID=A0AAV1Z2G4_9ARAC